MKQIILRLIAIAVVGVSIAEITLTLTDASPNIWQCVKGAVAGLIVAVPALSFWESQIKTVFMSQTDTKKD